MLSFDVKHFVLMNSCVKINYLSYLNYLHSL